MCRRGTFLFPFVCPFPSLAVARGPIWALRAHVLPLLGEGCVCVCLFWGVVFDTLKQTPPPPPPGCNSGAFGWPLGALWLFVLGGGVPQKNKSNISLPPTHHRFQGCDEPSRGKSKSKVPVYQPPATTLEHTVNWSPLKDTICQFLQSEGIYKSVIFEVA